MLACLVFYLLTVLPCLICLVDFSVQLISGFSFSFDLRSIYGIECKLNAVSSMLNHRRFVVLLHQESILFVDFYAASAPLRSATSASESHRASD